MTETGLPTGPISYLKVRLHLLDATGTRVQYDPVVVLPGRDRLLGLDDLGELTNESLY